MKPIVFALSLLGAVPFAASSCASSTVTRPDGTTMTRKEARQARIDARAAKAPQVYKGTVAEKVRVITDAPNAEKDTDEAKVKEKRK